MVFSRSLSGKGDEARWTQRRPVGVQSAEQDLQKAQCWKDEGVSLASGAETWERDSRPYKTCGGSGSYCKREEVREGRSPTKQPGPWKDRDRNLGEGNVPAWGWGRFRTILVCLGQD